MTAEALIGRLTADARSRIAALRADADAEIDAMARSRDRAAADDQARRLAERRAARQAAFAVERSRARLQAMARTLAAEHAFVDRVFAQAERLATAESGRHADAAVARLHAALSHLGNAPATLRSAPALADALRAAGGARADLRVVTDPALDGGFVLATEDGRCTIDCTPSALLAALRPQGTPALLALLARLDAADGAAPDPGDET